MQNIAPAYQTVLVVSSFAVAYMVWALRKTIDGKFDLYDFIMLSAVAILPLIFTLFPTIVTTLSRIIGVLFPFVVMFGALFFVVFVFMHRMTVRLRDIERKCRDLIQEVGLLLLAVEEMRRDQMVVTAFQGSPEENPQLHNRMHVRRTINSTESNP